MSQFSFATIVNVYHDEDGEDESGDDVDYDDEDNVDDEDEDEEKEEEVLNLGADNKHTVNAKDNILYLSTLLLIRNSTFHWCFAHL